MHRKLMLLLATTATMAQLSTAGIAGPKITDRYTVEIDGHPYRVLRLDNGRVKVVEGGMFGSGPTIDTRDRMRKAVIAATKCEIYDEYWRDGKLTGDVKCPSEFVGGGA